MTEATTPRRAVEVVDAAAALFHVNGYASTTVQDVADALGILKGSVYHYITTKEDLLFAVAEQAHVASTATVESVRALDGDVPTRLRAFVGAHLRLLFREQVKIGVYLHDFRSLSPEHRTVVARQRADYAGYLQGLVEEGQRDGSLVPGLDPRLATLGILGMLNWSYEWFRPDGDTDAEQVVEAFTEMALRSLTAPGA